jgi:type VI secretion system ImpJ/VasE family protein
MPLQIHWQEGLFLQPHHLQRMQKSQGDLVVNDRRLSWLYPYGVIDARVSRDELENLRLRFERLRVVMPSGVEVNFPENAELPSLEFKQAFSKGAGSFTVFLGVPLWQNARANTVSSTAGGDSFSKLLYRVGEVECADENTGENPKPIQVRKINARLMLENEDAAEMELVPLMRIVRATGESVGLPKADPEFVPPCMVLAGSAVLLELVRDLVNQVEASRKELVVQITRGGFSVDTMRGLQYEQMLRLRTLNRFSARLPALLSTPNLPPFTLYLEFRELLGELAALHPDRDEFECAAYRHDSPYACFREVSNKVRSHLRGSVAPSFIKVKFQEADGKLTGQFAEEHFTRPNAYFLAIKTTVDPTALARFVEDMDKFKIMPASMAERPIRGIKLKEERHAPLELPASSDLQDYRLDRAASARMWDMIQQEKAAVVRWTGSEINFAGSEFTLYMTVPSASGG